MQKTATQRFCRTSVSYIRIHDPATGGAKTISAPESMSDLRPSFPMDVGFRVT